MGFPAAVVMVTGRDFILHYVRGNYIHHVAAAAG